MKASASSTGSQSSLQPTSRSEPGTTISQSEKKIRVVIAEDHPVVRTGIVAMLSARPGLEVVAEAKDGQEALRKAKEFKPDVLLVDIEMPQLNGFVVTEILHKELPQVRVVILSAHSGSQCVPRILQSGARGFVAKEASGEELTKAVETVAAGGTHFGPEVAQSALNHLVQSNAESGGLPRLTVREKEILTLIAEGLYNKEIAARLNLGTRTVETHRERIMRKLNIRTTAGLTTFAVANGFVVVPDSPKS
jgi:DNA-binding NarL/FixJ family response regulator